MKRINNSKFKISVLIFAMFFMTVLIILFLVNSGKSKVTKNSVDESEVTFSYKMFDVPCTNEYYNGSDVHVTQARVDKYVGYSLDYGLELPEEKVKYLRELSPVTTSVIKYGYPNATPEQLGVKDEKEAEFATQLAVLGTVHSKNFKDALKSNKVLDVDNLKPASGYEEYMNRVKAAARNLIDKAITDTYYSNPRFFINPTNTKMHIKREYMLAGPYKLEAAGFEAESFSVGLTNAPASAQITDENGNEKTTFENNDDIYIKMDKIEEGSEFIINASVKGNIVAGKVYGTGNMSDDKQDYAIIVNEAVKLSDDSKVKWNTLTGNIKIYSIDQYKNVVPDVKFELRDMNDKVVSEGIVDSDGILKFNDIKIGKYKLIEVSGPDGYVFAKEPFEFEVTTGNTKEITFQNKKKSSE